MCISARECAAEVQSLANQDVCLDWKCPRKNWTLWLYQLVCRTGHHKTPKANSENGAFFFEYLSLDIEFWVLNLGVEQV
jgi:hypothetical protein